MKENWQKILQQNLIGNHDILETSGIKNGELHEIRERFPVKINRKIIRQPLDCNNPVWKQFFPGVEELKQSGQTDPLQENKFQKAPFVIHRYPNRVLFLISTICASYCRFCTRKRIVGKMPNPGWQEINKGLKYIEKHHEIDEVILSGGDPFLLADQMLEQILKRLQKMKHVEIIRISSRTLLTLPERITGDLLKIIKQYQPIYMLTQFNHPDELSHVNEKPISRLINNGIPVLNQSVLLKGINDNKEVMLHLVKKLIRRRIRPYYLHQLDPVKGALHFQVSIKKGREIIEFLRENIGGYAVPAYVFDNPEAKSKMVL